MALKLKHWIIAVVLLCAGMAVLLLPPRWGWWIFGPQTAPRRQEIRALERASMNQMRLLQQVRWADSIDTLVQRADGTGLSTIVAVPRTVSPMEADTIRRALKVEAGSDADRHVVLGVMLVDAAYGTYRNRPLSESGFVYFVGGTPAPHCFIVDSYRNVAQVRGWVQGRMKEAAEGTLLGPCKFVARYAVPGAGIRTWLENDGGYSLAYDSAQAPAGLPARGAQLFGLQFLSSGRWHGDIREKCLAGDVDACRRTFLGAADTGSAAGFLRWTRPEQTLVSGGPTSYIGGGFDRTQQFYGLGQSMLHDLEHQFGTERFAEFWHSDADVETAFRTAFGEPVGEWVMQWARQRMQPLSTLSLAAPGHLAETLATLVLAMLLAAVIARRRQTG